MHPTLLLVTLVVPFTLAAAFIPHPVRKSLISHQPRISSISSISSSTSSCTLFASQKDKHQWDLTNDFPTFLNQCSIQSFMFLLRQLRDLQTVLWMETFTQPSIELVESNHIMDSQQDESVNTGASDVEATPTPFSSKLLQYHGLAAINTTLFPTWDSYFLSMLQQDKESWTITSTKPFVPSYDWQVNPASLCARLLSVREQIAKEWVRDLLVIEKMGGQSIDSYWNALKQPKNHMDSSSSTFREKPNLLFLDYDASSDTDVAPSPLRKGNFDLLCLLTTQQAILRVLNDPQLRDGAPLVSNIFLQGFYQDRLHYFNTSQPYGRADDILQELLLEVPRLITVKPGVTALIDPIRIAESIVSERELVAMEWRELAQASPQEHFTVRKVMLNKLMGVNV